MTITIKRVESAEEVHETLTFMRTYSFSAAPPIPEISEEQRVNRIVFYSMNKHFAVYDNDTPVASASTAEMTQNVRGELYPMTGLWDVCTLPQARRKGYIRQVLAYLLREEYEAGHTFAGLYPFKESFYENMGYVTFPKLKRVTFAPSDLTPILKADIPGEVEFALMKDGINEWRNFLYTVQRSTHGMAEPDDFESRLWTRYNDNQWVAFVHINDEIRGAMMYQIKDEGDNRILDSEYSYALDAVARYKLLDWLARHEDQVDKIRLSLQPSEYPETWVANIDLEAGYCSAGMGRVLNVEKIAGMQVGIGQFTATIIDQLCPWNAGNYEFKAVNGRLEVNRTDKDTNCVLTIQGLSALIFGTLSPETLTVKGWGNPSPDVQMAMRAMFPPMMPYMHVRY